MRINEIELISKQNFDKATVERYLSRSSLRGTLDEYTVNMAEFVSDDTTQIAVILTDAANNIAAYAGFISRLNGRVWQAKNAQSYSPYSGRGLVGLLYKYIKENLKKSIQSDDAQTLDSKKLWTKTLPSIGLYPMIYDTKTDHIIDPKTANINMYPDIDDSEVHRYIWILERNDRYPQQNRLMENSLLIPLKGLWYTSSH